MSCSDNPLSLVGSHANGCIVYGMVFPFPLRVDRSDLHGILGARHPMDDEVIKGRNGVGLGPQTDLPRAIARVPMIQKECAVERGLDVIPHRLHPDRMPRVKRS